MAELLSDLEWQEVSELLQMSDFDDVASARHPTVVQHSGTDQGRFLDYSTGEAQDFINGMENSSTKKKTVSDMRQFKSYLIDTKNETREIENIPITELDTYFGNFLIGARKVKDNSEYEPSTLRGFMSSLDRYLKQHGWTCGVTKNVLFPHSNAALTAKQKDLKSKGLGNRPNESDELTDADVELLFQNKALGDHSPEAVVNLLHLNFSLVLGMRGGKEQRQLRWGDIEIGIDEDGDEYLVHKKERSTKTRTGQDVRNIRQFKPKAWSNSIDGRCPVAAYKLYAEKRPSDMMTPESPFFLAINVRNPVQGQAWYKNCAMGVNTIYGLTKRMWSKCKGGEAQGDGRKITNHSVRKHLVQKCVDLNLPPTETIQISGHKNLHSVNNYSKMNMQKQKVVAKTLANPSSDMKMVPYSTHTAAVAPATPPIVQGSVTSRAANASNTSLSYSQQAMSSVFGANTTISGGNFYFGGQNRSPSWPSLQPRKFRRILPLDFSDED